MRTLNHGDYKVGWVCALPLEAAAAEAMLDEQHGPLSQHPSDHNSYILGRIGNHNVVVACLPIGRIGTHNAAIVASQMGFSFQSIKINLMVGIGGGVPSDKNDIRLGDVVVSKPGSKSGGVILYDHGKTVESGQFIHTGTVDSTSPALLAALGRMEIKRYFEGNTFPNYMSKIPSHMQEQYKYPGADQDMLFAPEYEHPSREHNCGLCDPVKLVTRKPRSSTEPVVHYGTILSANRVMRHGLTREELANKFNALCIEMEAAGLMNQFRCAVIRGISDYSDTHKDGRWKCYAALSAAAYTKELLELIPTEYVTNTQPSSVTPGPSIPLSAINLTTKLQDADKSHDENQSSLEEAPSTTFFTISVPYLVDVLVRLTSWLIVEIQKYSEIEPMAAYLVEQLKARQTTMQGIFQIVNQESASLGPEFEQDIEEGLSKLQNSLMKAYRKGVALKLFPSESVQPDTSNVAYWGRITMIDFLKEYDMWEKTIKIRLHVLRMSKISQDTLLKESSNSLLQLSTSSEHLVSSTPIDTDLLAPLPCSWVYCLNPSAATIVEFRNYPEAVKIDSPEILVVERNVLDTVHILKGGDERVMSIPRCVGYYHDIPHHRFVMTYAMPRDYGHPRSLRDVLTHPEGTRSKKSLSEFASALGEFKPNNENFIEQVLSLARSDRQFRHPLDHRLRFANQLARSILYVHSAGLVHKHINPENILLITRAGVDKYGSFPYTLGDPVLVGFDRTRGDEGESTGRGELDIADCLYHHPDRWGEISGMRYSMIHDIYSLGVVLLEIALWDPLVVWLPKKFGFRRERFITWKVIRDLYDVRTRRLRRGKTASDVQVALIKFAKYNVPPIMGQGYTNVIISCLSGEFKAEGEDFKDGGMGFLYMINVISKLEKLQLQ